MGHGLEVYFPCGMRELGVFGGAGGLDKIWRVAPEMVQNEDSGRQVLGAVSTRVKCSYDRRSL
jgi:hypothetical protein